jgi:hypothetical protein
MSDFSFNTLAPSAMDTEALRVELSDLRGRLISAGLDYEIRMGSVKRSGIQASQLDVKWATANRKFVNLASVRIGEVEAEYLARQHATSLGVLERRVAALEAVSAAQKLEIEELKRHTHVGLSAVLERHMLNQPIGGRSAEQVAAQNAAVEAINRRESP